MVEDVGELGDFVDDEVGGGVVVGEHDGGAGAEGGGGAGEMLGGDGGVAGGFPYRAHAGAGGAGDVGFEEVADEEGAGGGDVDLGEGHFEDAGVGFAVADGGRVDADGEEFEEVFLAEVAVEAVGWDEGVGDEGEFGAGVAELGEHVADAFFDVGGVGDGLVPEPGEVEEVGGGEGEAELLCGEGEGVGVAEVALDEFGPEVGAAHVAVVDLEIAVEGGEGDVFFVEVVVGEAGALFEEDFGFAAADAKVDDSVAEVEEHGVDHAI